MTDLELTTHIQCLEGELPILLRRFAAMLRGIGFTGPDLDHQFAHVHWESGGEGFGFLCEPITCSSIPINGQSLCLQPYILGYTDYQRAEGPWVQLSLVFDSDFAEKVTCSADKPSVRMLCGAGNAIWRLATAFAEAFPESGIFFSDGPSVNLPWAALTGAKGDLWWFDLAIIPAPLISRFTPQPDGYASSPLSDGAAIAPLAAWDVLPWLDV